MNDQPTDRDAGNRGDNPPRSWLQRLDEATLLASLRYGDLVDSVRGHDDSPPPSPVARWVGVAAALWLVVVVVLGRYALPAIDVAWGRWLLAALLLPPTVAFAVLWVAQFRRADELRQRVETTAMAATFALAVLVLLAILLLRAIGIAAPLQPLPALYLLCGGFIVIRAVLRWRYR